jgi:P4 family phage/plasmid primase-like protien
LASSGNQFFHPEYGLRVGKLADVVRAAAPVLVDNRDQLWVYDAGVWRADAGDVRRRVVEALGERMRDQHLRNLLTVLRATSERFEVGPTPELLNLTSGILRWGGDPDPVLLEHHPEYMSTVQIPVPWDPTATCPQFDAFLTSSVPPDDLDRAWQVLGYLVMSGNPLQRMFMLTGSGGNGKGVFLNIVRALLGDDNFAAVPLQDFSENRFSSAELFGKLANICGDIDSTFIQSTGRIKELCGDDKINAERKGEHPFKFLFWGKAIFSANAIPGAADSSRGWLRRWEVVEFPYAPTKPDPDLSARIIRSELPGILVKAVYALRDLMAAGEFSRGESADNAHAEFAEKANRVIRWMHDGDSNVVADDDCWNKGTILLSAFRQWDAFEQGNGHKDIGVQRFNELARQAGLVASKRRGVRGYYGLRVLDSVMVRPADRPHLNLATGEAPKSPPMIEQEAATLL